MIHLEYIRCPVCGTTLEEIKEECKIGCQNCLIIFREAIEEILVEKMGSITYAGSRVAKKINLECIIKNDKDENNDELKEDENNERKMREKEERISIAQLKQMLEKSVAAEDYEAAIYFRNEIKRLEKA